MTHEIKALIETAFVWQQQHKLVLATVVKLEGSSYRRPGARMLLAETGASHGAVSGGCVEKEVFRQAQPVFETGKARMMTYDGRLRLGCDGIVYLLLEPLHITDALFSHLKQVLDSRQPFVCHTHYNNIEGEADALGSEIRLGDTTYPLGSSGAAPRAGTEVFSQTLPPLFQLYIFGAEHDAVKLCAAAAHLGWAVTVVAAPDEARDAAFFPGVTKLIAPPYDQINTHPIDAQTAVVLMAHSFHKDTQYLIALRNTMPAYIGLLGPARRREQLIEKLLEYHPDTPLAFIEQLRGPAGINIGAEDAAEIAVSIMAEILSVVRQQAPVALRDKKGDIHA